MATVLREEPEEPLAVAAPGSRLLATKLHVPFLRGNKVHRQRLFDRLDEGAQTALTLVAAPAGFGKSTLVSDWLRSRPRPAGWISLEPSDSDLRRFLTYLAAAFERPLPGSARGLMAALAAAHLPDPEALLTPLLNELWDRPGCVLVLDDYHVIEAPEIHEALAFLVEHLPPEVHLVVATRSYPPLHLSRLRARGLLCELRAQDLRFTGAEAADFLRDSMGLDVTAEEVESLERRTEGWIAGLQMAALSLRGRDDAGAFLAGFSGSHRFVLDYLTEEVLDRLPAQRLDFLLRTSILPRLCGPLCDAVTGRQDGQAVLESLETANLFLLPLDERRGWYRYHHLFASLLQDELRRRLTDAELCELHRRAADWFAQHHLPEEALAHAGTAADWERVLAILERYVDPYLNRGEVGTVARWFEAVPRERLHGRPKLLLALAVLLFSLLRWPEFNELMLGLEDAVAGSGDPELAGRLDLLRSFELTGQGDFHGVIAHARRALERLPEGDPSRAVVIGTLGMAQAHCAPPATALATLEESAALNLACGNLVAAVLARCHQGWLEIILGHLRAARHRFEQGLAMLAAVGAPRSPAAAPAYTGLAEVALEMGDVETAFELATTAAELGRAAELTGQLRSLGALAHVQAVRGELVEARQTFERLSALIRLTQITTWNSVITAAEARFDLIQARLEKRPDLLSAVGRWAESERLFDGWDDLRAHFLLDLPADAAHLTLARWLIDTGQPDRALDLLARLEPIAVEEGWNRSVMEVALLEALARQNQADAKGEPPAAAFEPLARALAIAEPEGYLMLFLAEGPPLARLLQTYRAACPASLLETPYGRRLRQALGLPVDGPAEILLPAQPAPPLRPAALPGGEALSDRELEVLRAVASGLSNADAARRLYLSPFTVKKHLENIYGKLGVHNRTEAIVQAQRLGLLTLGA